MSKLKKLLLIFQTPDNGGTRTYFYQITQFLIKHGFSIHLLVKANEFTGNIPDYCKQNQITVHFFNDEIMDTHLYQFKFKLLILYLYNYGKQVAFLWSVYRKIKPRLVIISQGWPFHWFRALFLPGRKIYVQHVMPLHPLDKGGKRMLKLALLFRQGTFISVSDYAQRMMRQFWLGNYKKVQTIYNYSEPNIIEKRQSKNNEELIILCASRAEEGKNPLIWAELAQILTQEYPQVKFVWAGKGSLLEEARQMTFANDRIQFIGFVSNVSELFMQADIYFEPSKREAHGISVVDAMAYHLPVIATTHGGPSESVSNGNTGYLVDVSKKEQMLASLRRLINEPELRKTMGEKGFERFQKMFTKEIWTTKMEQLIK